MSRFDQVLCFCLFSSRFSDCGTFSCCPSMVVLQALCNFPNLKTIFPEQVTAQLHTHLSRSELKCNECSIFLILSIVRACHLSTIWHPSLLLYFFVNPHSAEYLLTVMKNFLRLGQKCYFLSRPGKRRLSFPIF